MDDELDEDEADWLLFLLGETMLSIIPVMVRFESSVCSSSPLFTIGSDIVRSSLIRFTSGNLLLDKVGFGDGLTMTFSSCGTSTVLTGLTRLILV